MFDHWFPALSPSGRLAVGSQTITVFENGFANPRVIGPGLRPTWDGETLYYLSPEGFPMRWDGTWSEQVAASRAFNEFSVHNGFWAGHRTDPPRIIWQRGGESLGWWKVRLNTNTGFSALRHADGALCLSNLGNIIDTGVREHQFRDDLLVWVKGTEIFGRWGNTNINLTIPGEKHFYAFPLEINDAPWVLTHTDNRLLLYPWGETRGYVLNSGISDNPVAHVSGTEVTAVWSAGGEVFGHKRRITDARVDLAPTVKENIEILEPVNLRLKDFFVGGDAAWPRDGSHPLDQKWDGRNFWLIKFGSADNWERWVFDGTDWWLREDRSQSGAGDYSFHPGRWHKDQTFLGERFNNPDNILQRYDPKTGAVIDQHRFPYSTVITRAWRRFDCGGDIGVLEHPTLPMVIEFTYDPGTAHDTVEHYYFARGYGLVQWQVADQDATATHTTVFNERSSAGRLTPTTGQYKPLQQAPPVTPPQDDMTDAEVRALLNFTIPQDIYLGAYDQFIANLLPRDRITNATCEDGETVEVRTSTRGAQMFFNPLYYRGISAWIADRKRHPRSGPEWGDASMRGLILAITEYNKLKEPVQPPVIVTPPTGDRVLRPFQGQVRLSNGFVDNAGYVKPVGCHLGDLLSVAARNWGRFIELLDFCVAAGYPYIRFWTTLGGDSDFWHNRGVGPEETPDYWGLLERVLREFKARGMQAHIAQGDLRPNVVPDRREFARLLAEVLGRIGPDVCFVWEALNECRDTGEPNSQRLAEFAQEFRNHRPEPLITLSAFTGHEDVSITNNFSRSPAQLYCVHGYRDGHYWDKIRHIFSFAYESKPEKREGLQGEPFAPGIDVSASQNKHELDGDVMSLGAIMSLMTRQAWNYFSGPGVRTDQNHERLEHMPGFWETPRAVALLPDDITSFHRIFHGGETWRNDRVFAAQGDVRADHAMHADGRFVCLIYGPGDLNVPQTRGATITLDHRFGDKGRLVIGQAH